MSKSLIVDVYPRLNNFKILPEEDGGSVRYVPGSVRPRTDFTMNCIIGLDNMKSRSDNFGYVRDVDVIWVGKHIAHEAKHLNQKFYEFQQSFGEKRSVDSARMACISDVFHGYNHDTYPYRIDEMDADIFGFENAVKYFNENGFSNLYPKECLFARAKELHYFRGSPFSRNYDSYVQSMKDSCLVEKSNRILLNNEDICSINLLGAGNVINQWKDVIFDDSLKGFERDRQLFAVALDLAPEAAARYRILDKDIKDIHKDYPSRLSVVRKMDNSVRRFLSTRDYFVPDFEEDVKSEKDNFEFF